MGRSIVITSGKGGTGKTAVTASVGTCLAAMGSDVICVDADAGARNLDIALGMQDMSFSLDLADALERRTDVVKCLASHPMLPKLRLLPAPLSSGYEVLNAERFPNIIAQLAEICDFVLVDSPAGMDTGFSVSLRACGEALFVVTADAACLRVSAQAACRLPPDMPASLIVNKLRPLQVVSGHAPDMDDIIDAVGLPLLGIIPDDEMVPAAMHTGRALAFVSDDGAILAALGIARRLLGERVPFGKIKQWKVNG